MKILIDAMGGDKAPAEIIRGSLDAAAEFGVSVILVGKREEIERQLTERGAREGPGIEIIDAREVVAMDDDPSRVVRGKKDSSMIVAVKMLSEGRGDAMVSAGNTGALLSAATLIAKRIAGVRRASLAPVIPNGGKGTVLIDSGANVECTPEYLLQFAYMGSFYSRDILKVENPRIGLLNIGAEETKGTKLQIEAYKRMRAASDKGRINFIGNVEARDVLSGGVDVIVTDGYSGNIMLKSIEGAGLHIVGLMKAILKKNWRSMLAAMVIKKDFYALRAMMDSSEIGGTPLLGISKPVIKAHGSSDARAIRSAVKQAIAFIEADVAAEIEANIKYMKADSDEATQ